jgi:hypothetical protein
MIAPHPLSLLPILIQLASALYIFPNPSGVQVATAPPPNPLFPRNGNASWRISHLATYAGSGRQWPNPSSISFSISDPLFDNASPPKTNCSLRWYEAEYPTSYVACNGTAKIAFKFEEDGYYGLDNFTLVVREQAPK